MNITLTTSDDLETLEHYAVALITGMVSLRTLEAFHIKAMTKGIFKTDEEEMAKTICWELRRLMKLYMQQAENVFDILPDTFSQEEVLQYLQNKFQK